MPSSSEEASSPSEKPILIILIINIVVANVCVMVNYLIHRHQHHWPDVFVLAMAFLDVVIGALVLPLRYVSMYGRPMNGRLCLTLCISEGFVVASVLYTMLFMICARLFDFYYRPRTIRRRYLVAILALLWLSAYLLYAIPYLTHYRHYLDRTQFELPTGTSYCNRYTTSVYHSAWLAYTEIGLVYLCTLSMMISGIGLLLYRLCLRSPRARGPQERNFYRVQRRTTWHVFVLGLTLVLLWSPWIITRILIKFNDGRRIQRALQITHYIMLLKCVLFPILYASTNPSFRFACAIHRHQRVITNNGVWTTRARR